MSFPGHGELTYQTAGSATYSPEAEVSARILVEWPLFAESKQQEVRNMPRKGCPHIQRNLNMPESYRRW